MLKSTPPAAVSFLPRVSLPSSLPSVLSIHGVCLSVCLCRSLALSLRPAMTNTAHSFVPVTDCLWLCLLRGSLPVFEDWPLGDPSQHPCPSLPCSLQSVVVKLAYTDIHTLTITHPHPSIHFTQPHLSLRFGEHRQAARQPDSSVAGKQVGKQGIQTDRRAFFGPNSR